MRRTRPWASLPTKSRCTSKLVRYRTDGKIRLRDLTREWDAVADLREEQIVSRTDLSFHLVLVPELERLARDANWSRVLDAGCGTGVLTSRLARRAKEVVGVDMSRASIEIANARHAASNITYVRSTLERYVAGLDHPTFTLAVCNMTLMTVPKLTMFAAAIARSLRPGGTFLFTVTHPWFWPAYWGYDKAPWFDYNRELAIEAPFRISLQDSPLMTTHFHRPQYPASRWEDDRQPRAESVSLAIATGNSGWLERVSSACRLALDKSRGARAALQLAALSEARAVPSAWLGAALTPDTPPLRTLRSGRGAAATPIAAELGLQRPSSRPLSVPESTPPK
jgi:SAM-dependent methyltransferase